MEQEPTASRGGPSGGTSGWEWVAAASGALLVVSALLYLVYYGLTHPEGPPEVALERLVVTPSETGYLVQFKATNTGNSTAAALQVIGALTAQDGSTVEESETVLDYLPQKSERHGGLFFTRDPDDYRLQLRVGGYATP